MKMDNVRIFEGNEVEVFELKTRVFFELANCTECKYGQKDVVGRKCQACINKNMFEHI